MNLYLISPFVCADIDEKEIYLWWKWMIFPPSMRCGGICEKLQESHHDFSTFKVLKKKNSTINLPNGFISVDNRNQNPSVPKRCIEKAIKWIGMILHSLKISDVDAGLCNNRAAADVKANRRGFALLSAVYREDFVNMWFQAFLEQPLLMACLGWWKPQKFNIVNVSRYLKKFFCDFSLFVIGENVWNGFWNRRMCCLGSLRCYVVDFDASRLNWSGNSRWNICHCCGGNALTTSSTTFLFLPNGDDEGGEATSQKSDPYNLIKISLTIRQSSNWKEGKSSNEAQIGAVRSQTVNWIWYFQLFRMTSKINPMKREVFRLEDARH